MMALVLKDRKLSENKEGEGKKKRKRKRKLIFLLRLWIITNNIQNLLLHQHLYELESIHNDQKTDKFFRKEKTNNVVYTL